MLDHLTLAEDNLFRERFLPYTIVGMQYPAIMTTLTVFRKSVINAITNCFDFSAGEHKVALYFHVKDHTVLQGYIHLNDVIRLKRLLGGEFVYFEDADTVEEVDEHFMIMNSIIDFERLGGYCDIT